MIEDSALINKQVYNAPMEKVWRALTNAEEMRAWYFPQIQDFKPAVGFEFVFADDGSPYQKSWRVTHVEDGRVLSHTWDYKSFPGSSLVTFKLFEEDVETRLNLTHIGIGSFPDDPHFARERFESGWETLLGSNLRNHLGKRSF
jgi:uncharacterized protein YndB with AHSA1/START domain